jgi:hypothetical protein
MDEYGGGGGGGLGLMIVVFAIVGIAFLGLHIFFSLCMKKVCEKCGKEPGFLIWIPVLQFIPLMEVAGMPTWQLVLMLIFPVFMIMMILGLSKARNKSPAMLFAIAIFCGVAFWPYLAFSE